MVAGKARPLHDAAAIATFVRAAQKLQPSTVILGGDALDCGPITHHRSGRHGRATEGLRLLGDMQLLREMVLQPLEALASRPRLIYMIGNHEHWIDMWVDEHPEVEGLVGLDVGLQLSAHGWEVIPQGGTFALGKLHFLHGDTLRTANPAKYGVETFERSLRFGHFHRQSGWTKTSALDVEDVRTAIGVPGLCRRDPSYGRSAPNSHSLGFLVGTHEPATGYFWDTVVPLVRGRAIIDGVEV